MPEPIILQSCPKGYTADLDKAISPEATLKNIYERLGEQGAAILAECRRIDNGRLDIPVYLAVCGPEARQMIPGRKQMGKGSSPAQAQASAVMELMERFAFFSFWQNESQFIRASWEQAEALFGNALIPIEELLLSVQDNIDTASARRALNLLEWRFYPALNLASGDTVWLPLDWFKLLSEFNGSSAGNTTEESLLQGVAELIERHVSCLVDRAHPILPTIDPASCENPLLKDLVARFEKNGIKLILKDITLGMGMPTVAALAWDPATFPEKSEIVFTAGTASTPAKAAIRAITEVAQLGGDFCTGSCYEASGLPKFGSPEEFAWFLAGPMVSLDSLPSLENDDILEELAAACDALAPINVYAVATTHPALGVPAHYCVAPGLQFRERDKNQSLGLFIGRKLVEDTDPEQAAAGLSVLNEIYPSAPFIHFFEAMLDLQAGRFAPAALKFANSIARQPDNDSKALAAFYAGYALTQAQEWQEALPYLAQALCYNKAMKEAANLEGVALFKLGKYAEAELSFNKALKIDKGSAMDLANRGLARKFQGKTEAAIADLAQALELDPSLEFAAAHLADLMRT